jgi:hypothetical protein
VRFVAVATSARVLFDRRADRDEVGFGFGHALCTLGRFLLWGRAVPRVEQLFALGIFLVVVGLPLILRADGLAADWHSTGGWPVGPVRLFQVVGTGLVGLGMLPLAAAAWWWPRPPGGPGVRRF